ncbi:TPA: Gfo/Idh/MocA family oxidoreductase [Candidatus Poribacteria bacterium]|nr:Gfo/Idh/MocA family oxidoreductase [Candidatus Poribacteria bacterium]HIC01871.1 Gfo/Idh/MocA family oxidoreductase [Candidatus Poribacteria bacterium]HIM12525.1 Gfo/Idh/MocA family oxidoreductase [Candidatus Poribacteria bacterium]HIN31973.1 Gfo/Idh/MocA family oxidoreductase [Candidatus Poribacteria bacterium]HIO07638.1 Gfo/Idh/MocA family oxidoreductase [Candidatus Poribacteria bacterium]
MERRIKIGLVGAGMFGGDVHLRTYADLQRSGISPWLGRIGYDDFASEFADVAFELVGLGTRTKISAERARATYADLTSTQVGTFYGETPWVDMIEQFPDLDILAVATPDHLHTAPILHGLQEGVHAVAEKPMTLNIEEADRIIELAQEKNLLVGLDMHKRYDPDHLKIFHELVGQMGKPIYGRAVLEEPLEVSTRTFKWVKESDPFSYVGVHWTDLFISYLNLKPVSIFAVGQKTKLTQEYGIDAYDAAQVSVIFDNGMHVHFANNWITPDDFEGPVNQEIEILMTGGKIESDSQYRGLRYTIEGGGSHTSNTHFTRDVLRDDGSKAYIGYGKDSLIACILGILRIKFNGESLADLDRTYPTAKEGRISVAIIEAARNVMDLNFAYLQKNMGTPVTAKFGTDGITILNPYADNRQIYDKSV